MSKNICLKHLMLFFLAAFMCINSFFVCGFAENSTPSKDQQPAIKDKAVFDFQDSEEMPEPDLKRLVLRVFVMLGVILLCIVVLIYILKFFMDNKKSFFDKQDKYVQLIDRLNIENKKSVYLIKIIDEILVVGTGADSFTLLTKITDEQKVKALTSKEFMPLLNLFSQRVAGNKDTIADVKNESH
ncbi:flagellar biosynthetic protein FliO [bacterium]|nr:flagellar biosynthetic protein FliO [bacterium]